MAFPVCGVKWWTLARLAYPDLENHKLENLIRWLGLKEQIDADCPHAEPHDALYDAIASARLIEHILALPGWEDASVEDLSQLKASAKRKNR